MFNYNEFRVNLKLKRRALKITQEEIANEANLSEKNLSSIEKAKQEPNLTTIISILNYFNTSVALFMNNDESSIKEALINKIKTYTSTLSKSEKEFILAVIMDYRKEVE